MTLNPKDNEKEAEVKNEAVNEDKLKAERTNLRRLFTVAANGFDDIHRNKNSDKNIDVQFSKVCEKAERLFKVDQEIKEFINFTDEEYDTMESYRDRFTEIRVVYEKNYHNHDESKSVISSDSTCDNLQLPKLSLKEYDLIPRSWIAFWGQFSRVHEDKNLREEDKFQYLLSSLKPKTKARDIAESYPPSKENYLKVIEHLKSRFGRKDLLIEVYIRDLLVLVNNKSAMKLTDLYDKLNSYLRALESLNVTTSNYAAMLYPVVESCLPTEVLKAWDRHRLNREAQDDTGLEKEKVLEDLMSFLRHEVEGEEHRALAENAFGNSTKRKDFSKRLQRDEPTASSLVASSSTGKISCIFCERAHLSQECQNISKRSYEDRKAEVIRRRCCLVCLKPGHMAKRCHSGVKCLLCGRRHYALLCPDLHIGNNSSPKYKVSDGEEKLTEALLTNLPAEREVYLKTITIRLRHKGKEICVRALMDDGSHRSYVERDLVRELNLCPSGKEVFSQGLFGGGISPAVEHSRYNVTVESLDRKYSTKMTLLDQPKICSVIPRIRDESLLVDLSSRGIKLTDIGKDTPPIKVLLGADILGSILTGRIEVFPSGISAVETLLGWTVLGLGKKKHVVNMVTLNLQSIELPKLWDLEVLGITDPVERKNKSLLEEETLTHFKETLRVLEDKRYEVTLPWLAGHPALYDKHDIAESRLRKVTRRLKKENNFEDYDAVFRQWESEGIIESIPNEHCTELTHYLPHRPVFKPSSSTTKVRPVFDASFKQPGYASLNECLSVGPSLLHQIPPLLLRFRSSTLGVIADIKQAFLQVSVRAEDRDVLRFLWWEDAKLSKLKIYRHCRVVFGISSSPFLLNATINYHLGLQKFETENLQRTMDKLKEGFYVDNLVASVNDIQELEQLKSQSIEVMKDASFELRCWAHTGVKYQENQSVLGLKWDTETDELYCASPQVDMEDSKVVTKRKLLSVVNSIYDPIGFTSPATLLPKLLLQEAWRNKLDWDVELPSEMQSRYRRWAKNLHLVEKCRIPRRIMHGSFETSSLHIFTDASSDGYACCAFLRTEDNGEIEVSFVLAKARIAPVKRPTIPRLELLGALMGARICSTILKSWHFPLKTYFWTDSMIVLAWIKSMEPWNTFVGNRVKEIRELTNIDDWRHVPGEINPADLPTRSCDWSDLLQSQWWEDPSLLKESENTWPNADIQMPDEALVERKKSVICSTSIHLEENFSKRLLYFSEYNKIVRMVAWMLRFSNNAKKKNSRITSELTSEEIQRAELAIISIVQREQSSELKEKYAKSVQFSEESGIMKVKTKLILGEDSDDFQRPTVLPDHPIVRLYVEHIHLTMLHSGVQTTLNRIRERYWIPRGRRIVREVISKCVICKRHSSKQVQPDTAPLPLDRMKRVAAFQVTGVDLAGPLYLRQEGKAWIVLFTCGVYRAVHLELVTSLSSEAFMQAMRRFFARRGRCSVMYSDNGTNLSGTSRALQSLDWEKIQAECALQKIKWYFSPPSAPWYGGWWERMVRSIKQILRKCLGRACVTYEEMLTLLCDGESVINARPLTYVSDDPNELTAITPAHFIQDIRGAEVSDLDIIDSKHMLKRVRYIQNVRDNLRKRFQREYLGELVRNPISRSKRKEVSVGEIVLIGSDNAKRLNWPLGRVIELYPGKDGIQRVAKLRVASGFIIRPLQRLYPLEMSISDLPPDVAQDEKGNFQDDDKVPCNQKSPEVPVRAPRSQAPNPVAEVSQPVRQTRSGRRVVPKQRLNL